jgi:hypothetical protein
METVPGHSSTTSHEEYGKNVQLDPEANLSPQKEVIHIIEETRDVGNSTLSRPADFIQKQM